MNKKQELAITSAVLFILISTLPIFAHGGQRQVWGVATG
jgi:hypothetical protein